MFQIRDGGLSGNYHAPSRLQMRSTFSLHLMKCTCSYACALLSHMDCYPFFGPASICVYNRSYVLASHECLLVQMDLSTVETDVSSVGNNKLKDVPRAKR